jgi:hypothetical protein
VTPVRLKSRHSSAEIARWSPTEGGEDAACRCRAELRLEAIAHGFARLFHQVHQAVSGAEALALALLPDISGRAHAALEQPRLVIEPVRVGMAMRPAQPHGE